MWRTLRFILTHPLNRSRKFGALVGYVRWQIGSRLVQGPVAVPFVERTRLLVRAGMRGATGNLYCGLHEFASMGLVLHALRFGDLFVDVGANIGSYTILASGVCGASTISIEPVQEAFRHLADNVNLNGLGDLVSLNRVAVGDSPGMVRMTSALDTLNHVVPEDRGGDAVEVPILTLDGLLDGRAATLLKIDVEGYEAHVVRGAGHTLSVYPPLAVIVEMNGQGGRYNSGEEALDADLRGFGFAPCQYDPFSRSLTPGAGFPRTDPNVLYVRDIAALAARLRSAPLRTVHGETF